MPEILQIHIPCARTPEAAAQTQHPHEVINLTVPRTPKPRAAYYHDLLHQLWHHGYGVFTPADIFDLTPTEELHRDIYLAVEKHTAEQNNYTEDGNINRPIISPLANTQDRAISLAQGALYATEIRTEIQNYISLPRDQAITRTRERRNHHDDETIYIISEAEYWLRHFVVRTYFNDDLERTHEDYQAYLAEKNQQETH